MILLDETKKVVRTETTSVDIASGVALLDEEKQDYILLESRFLPQLSTIFENILIFDQRSQTILSFFTKEEPVITDITALVDEVAKSPHHLQTLSVLKEKKEYFFILSEDKKITLILTPNYLSLMSPKSSSYVSMKH